MRSAVETFLGATAIGVRAAPDGEEALRLWELRRPDLVLVDLGLPGIDGLSIVRRVRRDAATPIIVLSVRDQRAATRSRRSTPAPTTTSPSHFR